MESNCLRFSAKIQSRDPIQADRRFVVSYFMSDDSIYVYEPPVKNSGITFSKFLERCKVKKPNQPPYSTKLPEYYTYRDIYVGAVLVLNNFCFQLLDADDYCYKFMEQNNQMFPQSNVSNVMHHIRAIAQPESHSALESSLERADRIGNGTLDFNSFYSAIKQCSGKLKSENITKLKLNFQIEYNFYLKVKICLTKR